MYLKIKESNELIYEDALNSSTGDVLAKSHDQERSTKQHCETTATAASTDHHHRRSGAGKNAPAASNVVHISHLTRPFTVNQLKELLCKYGAFKMNTQKQPAEAYFWIDAVKSHCYVAYETEAEAESARLALHNVTWPASNPKQLSVEFSSMDDLIGVIERDAAAKSAGHKSTNGADERIRPGVNDKERKVLIVLLNSLKDLTDTDKYFLFEFSF